MDPLQLINELEGLRDKIPAIVRGEYETLLKNIRAIYEASIKFITPPQPVRDGKQNLTAHHTALDDLCTQLENSLTDFKAVYVGQGSDAYHSSANASLGYLQTIRDHVATVALQHDTMATNFDTATGAKIALSILLGTLVATLGVLIFSGGTTAPVTVPAAAIEAGGGLVTVGVLTEAEAAAAAALFSLGLADIPETLLLGALAALSADIASHLPPVTLPHPSIPLEGKGGTILPVHSHQGDLPLPGKAIGPNVYYPPKRKTIDQAWDSEQRGFEDSQGRIWVWDTKHKDHWDVQLKDGSHINVFPNGVERGEGSSDSENSRDKGSGNDKGNKGKNSNKGKK